MITFLINLIFCKETFFTVILTIITVYLYVKYSFSYWKRRNIYSPPTNSWMGHVGDGMSKIPMSLRYAQLYTENKDKPCVGLYISFIKQLLVNDLDLVRNVLSKDYGYFEGHGIKTNKKLDLLGQHLFNLEGEEWKRIRVKLTPTFTSSKMKYMYDSLYPCNVEMVDYLKEQIKISNDIEIKEVIAKLGTDVISSCAFGLNTNSFKDPDSQFRRMGIKQFKLELWMTIHDLVATVAPWITANFPVSRTPADITDFFTKVIKDTIAYREQNNVVRNDFLQLLIEMKNTDKNSPNHLTMDEIIPQVFVFFIAGFETSSTTVQYALLELAKNPELRDNLVRQLDEIVEANDGEITYELVYKLHCLDEVINETLRMYPPVPFLFRNCSKTYKVPNQDDVIIEKGTAVLISVYGIHHDPDIYPEPEKFIPERFTEENIKKRHHYSHLPFGEGPRICIGTRFGMMQSKLAILMILRNFHLELSPETQLPLKYDKKAFILLHTEGGMTLRLTERKDAKA